MANDNAHLELLRAMARVNSKDDLISECAWVVRDLFQADSCDILSKDAADNLVLRASTIVPQMVHRLKLGRGVGLTGQAFLTGEPIFIAKDAQKHKDFAKYPGMEEVDSVAIAAVPLIDDQKVPFGVILVRKQGPWRLSPSQKERLISVAEALAACVQGFGVAFQAGAQSNRLGALSEVSRTIAESPYLEEILQLLVNLTAQQFDYRVCTVRLLDENRGELVLRATQAPAKAYQRKRAIQLGESIAGRAIAENRPIIVRDVLTDPEYVGHDLAVEQGLRSMICVPLTLQDKPVGVLSCYTSDVRDFQPDEVKALETLAKQAAVSIEHAKLQVRNTLMQEMHHRVKNNLQQVASLLRLQMRMSTYQSLEEALNDTLSRILAIASVHDLLSREDLDHVGVRSIAETLVHHQQSSLIHPSRRIQFQVRGDDVTLNMNQATQVSLVLNELIQNAIEHGFEITEGGEIHVNIEAHDDEISIWISNNGDPLPEGFDPSLVSNLGLKIVDNLARALGGRFKMSEILGWTVAEVKFPRHTGE